MKTPSIHDLRCFIVGFLLPLALFQVQAGGMDDAMAAWESEVKTGLALKRQKIIEAKQAVYFLNRLELDGALASWQTIYSREAPSLEGKDELLTLNLFMLNLAEVFSGMRKLSAETAEILLEKGLEAEALALCLRAVSTGEDRCFQQKARLSENQRQLDWVAQPPKADEIAKLFWILGTAASKKQPDALLVELAAAELAKEYCEALAFSWKPDGGAGEALVKLASRQSSLFWGNVLMLEASLAFFREGKFNCALASLSEPSKKTEFKQRSAYLEGIIMMALGRFDKASLKLELAAQKGLMNFDAVLGSKAQLLCGEALETSGEWPRAKANWEQLLATSKVLSHRLEATIALQRMEKQKRLCWNPSAKQFVVPLADNRSTHGDWPMNMGREYHLLAAQQGKTDTIGYSSPQSKMDCLFRSNEPTDKCRLWVTQAQSADPAALWNPYSRCRTTANRDDYGEQYPIGKGPDLVLECDIPAGEHILSLYFVNDYNYYEANRAYTITLQAAGQLVACVPLRWFGSGVYKRFAIDGPRKLNIHIQRNASINVLISGVFLDKRGALFSLEELTRLQAIFPKNTIAKKLVSDNSLKDYNVKEEQAWEQALLLQNDHYDLADLLRANTWLRAGEPAKARECINKVVDALDNEKNQLAVEQLLYLLCKMAYWGIGGENELWEGEAPHPLERLWNTWLIVRRKRITSGDYTINAHQQEMFNLLQMTDWRIPASVRKEMWEDCSLQRKADSASWAYYAIAKQYHRENNEPYRDEFIMKALSTIKDRPNSRLFLRILDTRFQWQCLGEGKLREALETYKQMETMKDVSPFQQSTWCLQFATVYSNQGEYDNALKWLEKAATYGIPNNQIKRLRQDIEKKKETSRNGN